MSIVQNALCNTTGTRMTHKANKRWDGSHLQESSDVYVLVCVCVCVSVCYRAMLLGNALEAACRAVQRYTLVLGVAYALPKLDLVGPLHTQIHTHTQRT